MAISVSHLPPLATLSRENEITVVCHLNLQRFFVSDMSGWRVIYNLETCKIVVETKSQLVFSRAVFSEKVGIVAKHQRVGFYLLDPNTLVRKQRIESGGFFPLKFSLDGATLFGRGILDQDKDCACVWQTGDWSRADHAFPSFALEVAIDAQTRRIARNTADTIEGWQLHGDNKPKQLWSISKKYEDYGLTLSADGQSFFILVSTTHQFVPSKTERIMGLAMATGQWLWSVSMPEQCSGLSASLDGSKLFFSCLDLGVNGEQLTAKGSVGAILLDDKCIVDTGVTKTVARKESSGSFPRLICTSGILVMDMQGFNKLFFYDLSASARKKRKV